MWGVGLKPTYDGVHLQSQLLEEDHSLASNLGSV